MSQQQQQKHTPQIPFFHNLPGYDDDDPQIPNLEFISDILLVICAIDDAIIPF
jgi:hypothetical protein